MRPSSQSNWPSIRRGLILMMFFFGVMSLYTLFLGRPGDFAGGLVGMVIGGTAGLVVVLVEGIGRWLSRRRSRSAHDNRISDESA
jgi:ammonia channel protein AmtB